MIPKHISDDENFEYGYPHSNALLQFDLKLEGCMLHDVTCHTTKCCVINDVKLFLIGYTVTIF